MHRGIEVAFWATLGKDPELKTSKGGTLYCGMNAVCSVGKDDNDKDVSQWLRVTCFNDTAKAIAARARKGDRVYVEGSLSLSSWTDKASGETKTGLSVAAWKVERTGNIGKSRERKHGDYQSNGDAPKQSNGRGKHEFDDELSF